MIFDYLIFSLGNSFLVKANNIMRNAAKRGTAVHTLTEDYLNNRELSKQDVLRPLELATRRLINMIEIISNWNIYVPDASFLTQRCATILINEKDQILYEFISDSILGYSKNMSKPLSFLDEFLN